MGPPACCRRPPVARPPRSIAVKPKLSMSVLMKALGSRWSPETKITRRPPFFTGPSLNRAVTIELNALTMRAPGASAATTSLAPLPPRSARTSFGLVSTKGFVASMSTRPFQAGRPFNADSTFRQGTASNTYSRLAASSTEAADAPRPSSATLSTSASGPRRLLKTTSWPLASASRPNASATAPAPIVPNVMLFSYRASMPRLGGHPDDQLAEVASLQHSDEGPWRVFETVGCLSCSLSQATRHQQGLPGHVLRVGRRQI